MTAKDTAETHQLTDELEKAINGAQQASRNLMLGDAAPMKKVFSHAGDVMLFGGWGGYERGWHQVGPRLEWAASRFAGLRNYSCERLTAGESGEIGYECFVERMDARIAGTDGFHEMALRVTHIYRREQGGWSIVLRHADFLTPRVG